MGIYKVWSKGKVSQANGACMSCFNQFSLPIRSTARVAPAQGQRDVLADVQSVQNCGDLMCQVVVVWPNFVIIFCYGVHVQSPYLTTSMLRLLTCPCSTQAPPFTPTTTN